MRKVSLLSRLLSRPELGAAAGTVLVFVFFAVVAGGSGLFSAKGIINFLEVSAQLGILAAPVALLMIAGEFDLSIGSMIGFAGILIAIPAVFWGWPVWLSLVFAFVVCGGIGALNGLAVVRTGLPSFIVTLGSLFMLRGLTLGVTRGITGRTQVSGIHPLAADDPLNELFSGTVLNGFVAWLSDLGLIGKRADGLPAITGHSGVDRLVARPDAVLHLAPDAHPLRQLDLRGRRRRERGAQPRRAGRAHQDHAVHLHRAGGHAVRRDPGAGRPARPTRCAARRRSSRRSSPW